MGHADVRHGLIITLRGAAWVAWCDWFLGFSVCTCRFREWELDQIALLAPAPEICSWG